jgi:tripartite-type tricarboxylate transporter receptor subunit TctC
MEPVGDSRSRMVCRAVIVALLLGSGPLAAADWPARPIRMLVGYPAGGANDLVARALAPGMAAELGQPILVENKTGAAGAIAAEAAAKAAPDGYTLYMMSSAQVLAPSLQKTLPYDPVRDFAAITLAASSTYLVVVHPALPINSIAALIARAKAEPDQLTYASSGVGAGPHLATALFASMAGIKLRHVPYRGDAPALAELVAGQVNLAFMSIAATLPQIQAGKLRALATAGAKRSALLPDLPTVAEAGVPGYAIGSWWGLVAPAGTPAAIVQRVDHVVQPILDSPPIRARLAAMGFEPGDLSPDAFQRYIAAETARFADIVRRAGITPE